MPVEYSQVCFYRDRRTDNQQTNNNNNINEFMRMQLFNSSTSINGIFFSHYHQPRIIPQTLHNKVFYRLPSYTDQFNIEEIPSPQLFN